MALAKLYNLLLLAQYYPHQWRLNRTTLIPKQGKDKNDAANWWPITISSMLSRIFSGLIDRRLRRVVKQNERQKGFTDENGCYANVKLLGVALRLAKEKSGGVFCVNDVRKAFDTVPNSAIVPALRRKGIPEAVATYVAGMYINCRTRIRSANGHVEIELKRGVKQGDPLTPLLFNLVIEPLLEELQTTTTGMCVEGTNVAPMAFADDLVVIGDNSETATNQIAKDDKYLTDLGMSLEIKKSTAFEVVSRRKTHYMVDPQITIRNEKVPYSSPEDVITYLGVKITAWKGLLQGEEQKIIFELISRTRKLPLKPMQKLELLSSYLLPRIIYGLIVNPPSNNKLREIDLTIRKEIKLMLHLSEKTSTPFLYAPRAKGGLGLTSIEQLVQIAALRNATKALQSDDAAIRSAMLIGNYINQLRNLNIRC